MTTTDSQRAALNARIIRWLVVIHALAFAAQMALAIFFVTGSGEAFLLHIWIAWAVAALGVVQAIAILGPWAAKIEKIYLAMAILIVAGEIAQIYLGKLALTSVHVTLGMVLWGLSLAVLIRVLYPSWTTIEESKVQ